MFYIYYIILKLESLHIKTTVCTSVLLAIKENENKKRWIWRRRRRRHLATDEEISYAKLCGEFVYIRFCLVLSDAK
jgi:hypothetical protein